MMISKARDGIAIAALIAGFTAVPADAQVQPETAQATTAAEPSGSQLGDIIVTATRRDSNLQRTPIAVSAVDRALITQAAPRDIGDLAIYVPNFNAARITGFNAASFAMRGVGQTSISAYNEAPVVVLVDDFVYNSIQTQLLDTFDVAQVEVLRGPQGTLFGKNTTGGAVVVRTIRPDLNDFKFNATALVGSYGTREMKGAVSVPIIPGSLAMRLVGIYNHSDGYMRNGAPYGPIATAVPNFAGVTGAGDGKRKTGDEVFAGRVKLLWEPSDALTVLGQYEILRDHTGAPAAVNETPAGDPSFVWNALGLAAPTGDPLKNGGLTSANDQYITQNRARVTADGLYLNIDYKTDAGTLTSVTGYRKQRTRMPGSETGNGDIIGRDGTVLSLFDVQNADDRRTFQQELRFASSFDGPFNFVTGGFYQRDRTNYCVAMKLGFQDLFGSTTPYGAWNDNAYVLCNDQRATSKAAYFEGTYKVTDKLTATGGFRYTWDSKRWRGRQQAFVQDILKDPTATYRDIDLLELSNFNRFPDGVINLNQSWKDPSYRFILSYQATSDLFLYASYSHGFKSGGYNTQAGTFAAFGTNLDAFAAAAFPTDPEKADSYEVGVKGQFLDRRLRVNLTGFQVDYSDLQKQINVPIVVNGQPFQVSTFFNAAKARVRGLEGEVTAIPVQNFTLRGTLGYQDGKYLNYVAPLPAGYDLSEAPLDRTPKWQWSVDGTLALPIEGAGQIQLNGNIAYTARSLYTQSLVSASANSYLNPRTLMNASIGFTTQDERYFVRGIVRNITNKRYRVSSQTVAGLWLWSVYGAPRFFALEAGVRF